jgi:hypothetical protein
MVYNPAFDGGNSTTQLKVPLYYTGESDAVMLQHEEADGQEVRTLDRDYSIAINVSLPPLGITYYVIKRRVDF